MKLYIFILPALIISFYALPVPVIPDEVQEMGDLYLQGVETGEIIVPAESADELDVPGNENPEKELKAAAEPSPALVSVFNVFESIFSFFERLFGFK